MALCVVMCLFTTSAFAQEVRGVETRFVKDEVIEKNEDDQLYNVEFTNRNSIPVSVTMELWQESSGTGRDAEPEKLLATKDIVLYPGESYVWEVRKKKHGTRLRSDSWYDHYYVKYKAYKLQ